jgi:hypothetical protein
LSRGDLSFALDASPGAKTSLFPRAAPALLCASACPRNQKTRPMPRCAPVLPRPLPPDKKPTRNPLCRTAASKSHTLSPATRRLRMATSKRRAVRRRCPVRVWLSLRRLRLRLEYLEVSFNPRFRRDQIKAANISGAADFDRGMWRSHVSCCRIVPWTRPWLPGGVERLRSKPGMAIMLFANNSISLIGHLRERPYL